MLLATWNVNSIRARIERLRAWLAARQPDVVCLQELKVTDDQFPRAEIEQAGYRAVVHGQKTYNGVAILARHALATTATGMDDGVDDPQARLIAARVAGLNVVCAYAPNGGELGSDKWAYKLDWFRRLRGFLDRHFQPADSLVLCGDLNVAPEARDVHDPAAWEATVLFHPDARGALANVCAWGLADAFRLFHQEGGLYSWWDYRMLAFPRNHGLRIDHVLVSEPVRARCRSATVDRDARKGKQPSDHAPVLLELAE